MWRRDHLREADELIGDCEAFLAGRFAEHLEDRGDWVPMWAWTNLLAHATEEDLRTEVETATTVPCSPGGWRQARAYLAGELLDVADRYGPLERLQADALAPLELELAAQPMTSSATPGLWVASVLAAIDQQRPPRDRTARQARPESGT